MYCENGAESAGCSPGLLPAYSENNVPVIIACSNYYAPYAGVFIQSLADHATPEHNYDIIIMEREISQENKRLLSSLNKDRKNISIRFFNPGSCLPELKGDIRYPSEIFWRLYAPYLFEDYSKIITIGVDMLLTRDIAELFAIDLKEACLGAVRDIGAQGMYAENSNFRPSVSTIRTREYFEQILKLREPLDYVNGDVVLYNAQRIREKYNFSGIASCIRQNEFLAVDQDALNILQEGDILFISPEWNFMIPLNYRQNRIFPLASEELRAAYRRASDYPAVLHWADRPKPWVCPDVPYGNVWWEVAQRTPFMPHIVVRMIDELQKRKEYYKGKYGQDVAAWDPVPKVDRSKK